MRSDERAALERFRQRYSAPSAALYGEIEERVLGGHWGANGYTTKAQADELGRRLRLGPGRTLLDVGTGRGWPGLYLAVSTGCSVIGTDMPVEALAAATRRAQREGVFDRAAFAAAAGEDQPLRPGAFDAVVHTDVLC